MNTHTIDKGCGTRNADSAPGYVRVATRCQTDLPASARQQLQAVTDYCQRHDVHLAGIFQDFGVSGRTASPDGLRLLIDLALKSDGRITGVVVDRTNRLSRNAEFMSARMKELADAGIKVFFAADDDYHPGLADAGIKVFFAADDDYHPGLVEA